MNLPDVSSKVQRSVQVLALTLLVLLPACRTAPEAPSDDQSSREAIQKPIESRFGAPYAVAVNETPAAPDTPPGLTGGDTLAVTVRYAGGCEDHDFTLEHRTRRDTTRLWLAHDAGGEDCTEVIFDDLRLPLSFAPEAPTVVLLNPQGGAPFVLRWGEAVGARSGTADG